MQELVCSTAGKMAIEESLSLVIAYSRSLWQGCQHCEGARCQGSFTTAHTNFEQGGPSEWLVMPPDGVRLDRPPEGLEQQYARPKLAPPWTFKGSYSETLNVLNWTNTVTNFEIP